MKIDDYYFYDIYFEDINTGMVFDARIEEGDRFYHYLLPFIIKGKVESMTSLTVDSLCIPKSAYSNICDKTYKLSAKAIFREKQKNDTYLDYAGVVTIDKVCLNNVNHINIKTIDEEIQISLCDLEIQYQSRVQHKIIMD